MSVKLRADELRRRMGGVFTDEKNTYFSVGKDWWSIAYQPKYPEKIAADLIVIGYPDRKKFCIMGNLEALIPTKIDFCDFDDLCDYLKEATP